ncbi:MAG: CRISPR-associated protein Csn1 [Prevotellaceae bacterium]|nr:CRISPR-associated protein Csn1 [Prevotellaceae bacterium]
MARILGIDTGTNSLGWAIVDKVGDNYKLIDKGTHIFSEGVKIEKNGVESSKAAERTGFRSVRKHYWRRKIRKIRLLSILADNNLCPPLNKSDLREWRLKKVYPKDKAFMSWQQTEDKEDKNPYKYRYECLTKKLDLSDLTQRYILGRALYHLNQRRGFLSNRKESTKESDGAVKSGIKDLTAEMSAARCTYLGEYFYHLYQQGEKIRNHYTDRKEHYIKEFDAICAKQELEADLVNTLRETIFSQRPLKSQKWQVGKCTFEKGKSRCPASHPLYEDFRMYNYLNKIKVQTPADTELRPLTEAEKDKIIPLFKRKSKRTFAFEDIAKALAGKGNYCHYKDSIKKSYIFNYSMDSQLSGSVVNAQLEDIFGDNWLDGVCETYTLADGKSRFQIMNDIWHALFFYDDEEKLKEFAANRLQLEEERAVKFSNITLPCDYASLSLKAIRKILPYMKYYSLIYSQAVFFANLGEVLPRYIWELKEMREAAIDNIIAHQNAYDKNIHGRIQEQYLKDFLMQRYHVSNDDLQKLYHPSMLKHNTRVRPNEEGIYQLAPLKINSVKNPMAMHSLFRLRKVVNLLLKEGKINSDTTIHIEFARELNDANRRKAIQQWQRKQEKDRKTCEDFIKESGIASPTDTHILKYQLWKEQGRKCIYTGKQIDIDDFLLGDNPKFDIEHTIPRSAGGDSTKANLTLCCSTYNRDIKKAKIPSQLPEHEAILERVKEWKETYEDLDKRIRRISTKGLATKKEKDDKIQQLHRLRLERNYWRGKYQRFTMTEVPKGFSRRQGAGAGVISRYARLYLQSVFKRVSVVKGIATSDFRKMWEIQEENTKKERINHVHHCIDAIVIACIGREENEKLAQYYHADDNYKWNKGAKPQFAKPWPTFVSDIKQIQDEMLVSHYSKDNMPKQARRRIRDSKGQKVLAQGDTARGSLHNKTYYGAIEKDGEIKYVVRKALADLADKDVVNIVDDEVRRKVEEAIAVHGSLSNALKNSTIWMNEIKRIPIKKVRVFANTVARPLHIRQHRDESRHDYKRQYHVQNDRNYMVAIYIGNDKGKEQREFKGINMLDAAKHFKKSNENRSIETIIPPLSPKHGLPLAYKLFIGQMIILYDNKPEEVWEKGICEINKRLYKITRMSEKDTRMTLVHHNEARQSKELGSFIAYKYDGELQPAHRVNFSNFKALVQGVDFEINDLGEIRRLR